MEIESPELTWSKKVGQMSKRDLYHQIADCSQIDEQQLTEVVVELARKLQVKTTGADRLGFLVLACSRDTKQRSFGLDMLTNFVPPEESEPYMTAVYFFARTPEGEKNIAKINAATRLMITSGSSDSVEHTLENLAHKHEHFLERVSTIIGDVVSEKEE